MKQQRMLEVESLLSQGREIPAVLPAVRARALARARAATASGAIAPVPLVQLRSTLFYRVALVAAAVLVTGLAGAVVSMHVFKPPAVPAEPPVSVRAPTLVVPSAPVQAPSLPPVAPPDSSASEPRRPAKSVSPRESYAAELDLLRRAQGDYAAGDFSGALVLLNAHARQFPKGRLAEECEALRVSCLKGLGRSKDAHRAAASFAVRFPRSVLLPRTIATDPPANE